MTKVHKSAWEVGIMNHMNLKRECPYTARTFSNHFNFGFSFEIFPRKCKNCPHVPLCFPIGKWFWARMLATWPPACARSVLDPIWHIPIGKYFPIWKCWKISQSGNISWLGNEEKCFPNGQSDQTDKTSMLSNVNIVSTCLRLIKPLCYQT